MLPLGPYTRWLRGPFSIHRLSRLTLRAWQDPFLAFLTISGLVFVVTLVLLRTLSYRDPSSLFFNPSAAYSPVYSEVRRSQAETYIDKIANSSTHKLTKFNLAERENAICVGMTTIARKSGDYFRNAVGSLLEGLADVERQHIYLILFVAHSDPAVHPEFSEGWMGEIADRVLLYNASAEVLQRVQDLEAHDTEFREKPLFDYVYLLKACLATETPYILMLEDDIIAMDGWYHRTRKAIVQTEARAALKYGLPDFLYLRLFFTEQFLGWNKEDWLSYLKGSLLALILLVGTLFLFRLYIPSTRKLLHNSCILVTSTVHLPLGIMLFFAAGRMVVLPLPSGVVEMNNYGCCSQGLLFSRTMAPNLLKWYEQKRIGFVDMLTEEYGDKFGSPRWAISPSVLQHVGSLTSKTDALGEAEEKPELHKTRTVAETIWNFKFELNDPVALRREHAEVIRQG